MTSRLSAQELALRGTNLGPGLVDVVREYAAELRESLESVAPPAPRSETVLLEALCLVLHMTDRLVAAHLSPEGRRVFMDHLMSAVADELYGDEPQRDALGVMYNEKQFEYGQCRDLLPESNEGLKGTVCWEFGKAMSARYGRADPGVALEFSMSAAHFALGLSKTLADPAVGVVA